MVDVDGYSTDEAAERVGIAYHTLARWVANHGVTPSIHRGHGAGTQHRWSARDIEVLAAIRTVIADLDRIGAAPSPRRQLIARLWCDLHDHGAVVYSTSTAAISARLTTTEAE